MNAPGQNHAAIISACNKAHATLANVQLYDHPNNDVWCRDHGPIFVKHSTTGEIAITDWEFNAWGGKFAPWDLDNSIPEKVANSLQLPR
ncbi:MAG: agmatine deiminase family protein [Akkermansiaceae bacterium]